MRRLLFLCVLAGALAVPALASAAPEPVRWCGTDEVTQNRVPDLELSSVDQVRLVYAIPADGADNFLATASGIATDAAWIDQWWQGQDPTRAPRFDRYAFPGCTSRFGALDIGFLRLPNPASWYASPQTPSLRLDQDLAGRFTFGQKTIVYYDGPIRSDRVCGETDYLADSRGGDAGIVYVYLQSACDLSPPGTGPSAEVAAHELLHNLGAVPPGAPHECPDSPSHVCDSPDDVMAQFINPDSTLDQVTLDVGADDYYGHSGTWWDVQDSGWLSHLPQLPFSLGVQGSGSLVATAGGVRLPCDTGCTDLTLDTGTDVSVTAVARPGWKLASWSGGCSGTSRSCSLAVGDTEEATATFLKAKRVTVSVAGKGRVTSTPAGISCPRACSGTFTASSLRLTAKPARHWRFAGWSGACRGTGACRVTAAASVRARFVKRAE